MSDTPPDRLATDPASPYHDAAILERGVGVRFKGVEKTNVDEYCVSEGWVRLTVGTTVDRREADDDQTARAGRALFSRCARRLAGLIDRSDRINSSAAGVRAAPALYPRA